MVFVLLTGFAEKDQMMILQIMCALLHFGNIHIKEKDGEACEIPVSYCVCVCWWGGCMCVVCVCA